MAPVNVDEVLDMIGDALDDWHVGPDAMRCNSPEPPGPRVYGAPRVCAVEQAILAEMTLAERIPAGARIIYGEHRFEVIGGPELIEYDGGGCEYRYTLRTAVSE
jgi:hypothetical protein